jgi:hypothetical protein
MRKGAILILVAAMACRTAADSPSMRIVPSFVTTAGGTWVTIKNIPFDLKAPRVDLGMRDRSGREVVAWLPAEEVKMMDDGTLRFLTPRFIEACADVRITDGGRECHMPNAICFHTLAFTANQGTGNSSVVDTVNNGAFTPNPSMPFNEGAVPVSLAYSKIYPPARELYMLDSTTGDMSYYDAANFDKDGDVQLQNPLLPFFLPGAFDIALTSNGYEGFVSHITSGFSDPGIIPTSGGLSWLIFDDYGAATLEDVDNDCETTSLGAPEGITRAKLCVGDPPDCVGTNNYFHPLSVRIVTLATDVPGYTPHDREPNPGIYAFVSGVGYFDEVEQNRQVMTAVLDLNRYLYCDPSQHPPRFCMNLNRFNCSLPDNYCNRRWWLTRMLENGEPANYKTMQAKHDESDLGDTKHALGFSPSSGLDDHPPDPPTPLGPTLYLVNQHMDEAFVYHYDQTAEDWLPVMDGGDQFTITTGTDPTGITVQKLTLPGNPPIDKVYAYITNAGDDTVTVVNTATSTELPYPQSPIIESECKAGPHMPMAFDTRNSNELLFGYASNMSSNTVSVIDLVESACEWVPPYGAIELYPNDAPSDIVVQPVPTPVEIFGQMLGMMVFSEGEDYTIPEDKHGMLGDWKAIHQLVLTPAAPQAIKAAIEAFLRKIDQKVTKEKLKKHMKQGVGLYRVAYVHDHPGQ